MNTYGKSKMGEYSYVTQDPESINVYEAIDKNGNVRRTPNGTLSKLIVNRQNLSVISEDSIDDNVLDTPYEPNTTIDTFKPFPDPEPISYMHATPYHEDEDDSNIYTEPINVTRHTSFLGPPSEPEEKRASNGHIPTMTVDSEDEKMSSGGSVRLRKLEVDEDAGAASDEDAQYATRIPSGPYDVNEPEQEAGQSLASERYPQGPELSIVTAEIGMDEPDNTKSNGDVRMSTELYLHDSSDESTTSI